MRWMELVTLRRNPADERYIHLRTASRELQLTALRKRLYSPVYGVFSHLFKSGTSNDGCSTVLDCFSANNIGYLDMRTDVVKQLYTFLRDYMGFEVLSVYGVLVAITLANAGQIHLTLAKLEERRNKSYTEFEEARKEIKQSCLLLVTAFVIAIILLFA